MIPIRKLACIRSRLTEFGHAECAQYPGDGRKLFSLAVSQAQRYEFFLRMILGRYEETSTDFMGAVMQEQHYISGLKGSGPHELASEELVLLNKMDDMSPYIQPIPSPFTFRQDTARSHREIPRGLLSTDALREEASHELHLGGLAQP
jgi:hypothetical protein